MHIATASLPAFHPRVLDVNRAPLLAALVPRYVAALNQEDTIPVDNEAAEPLAQSILNRTLRLLIDHQGSAPVTASLGYLLTGDKTRQLNENERITARRLLELVVESSGLLVTNCEGTEFSLHPEWSRRFCERYHQREAHLLALTANWDSQWSGFLH